MIEEDTLRGCDVLAMQTTGKVMNAGVLPAQLSVPHVTFRQSNFGTNWNRCASRSERITVDGDAVSRT